MRCLVVLAHPVPASLCAHLASQVVTLLAAHGHAVTLEDLYAQGFPPMLSAAERAGYHGDFTPQGTEAQIARLELAEVLVLVFPTWWSSFPAILKGWFDRVWAPGRAFDHKGPGAPLTPRLTRLRHTIVVTTLGAPWWIDRLVLRQPLRRVLKRGILGACAPSAQLTWLSVHEADTVDADAVRRVENRLTHVLERLR